MMSGSKLNEVGYWTELKLEIVKKYASAYTGILAKQRAIQGYVYVDAFSGPGVHVSRQTGEYILGSPLNALNVQPPFSEYHFIDADRDKAEELRRIVGRQENVFVHEGDCNQILPSQVFPRCRYEDYRRALCLLDPYGIHLDWKIVESAGRSRSIEIFLNFSIMDINRTALWRNQGKVSQAAVDRMNRFWGDDSWREIAYQKEPGLFGSVTDKRSNEVVAEAYRRRLESEAGFPFVLEPIPMRNSSNAVVYYLYFASPNKTGHRIVSDIFSKYRDRTA